MSERTPDERHELAILGCGSVGNVVAQNLASQGKDLIIYDRDESRVEALRDQDLNAVEGDITDPEVADAVAHIPVVLILTSFVDDNEEALRNLRERNGDQYVIVRASDPVSQEDLSDAGADYVINPPQVIAESAIRALETGELEKRVSELVEIVERTTDRMAIVVHGGNDPDAIATAAGLLAIAESVGVEADIVVHSGGSQSTQGFANLIGLDLVHDEAVEDYETVALVDDVEGLEEHRFDVDILIAHKSIEGDVDVDFKDVRTNVGSASTITTKYLQEMGIDASAEVMTALLHGIRTETDYFRRNTSPADLTAAAYLYPFVDHELLEDLESPTMSPEEFEVLADSIRNREVYGSNLVSNVGFINLPDVLGRAAEQLLNMEGVSTAIVYGVVDDEVRIAARSDDPRVNIRDVLLDALDETADVVGHSVEASARLALGIFGGVDIEDGDRETLLDLVDTAVTGKILDSMGVVEEPAEPAEAAAEEE